ncbi:MAG: rhodanese-like domain-containing protein [Bacteroidota bacterium]
MSQSRQRKTLTAIGIVLVLLVSLWFLRHLFFPAWVKLTYHKDVKLIGPKALKDSRQAVLLDTRMPEEYAVSHLQNARFVGFDNFELSLIEDLPKDTLIITYCAIGYRSDRIAKQLIDAGYTNVHNLHGGIFNWKNLNYPVYKDDQQVEAVHPFSSFWEIWLR